jgi:DNA-binding beta-propeller fold protein YncE
VTTIAGSQEATSDADGTGTSATFKLPVAAYISQDGSYALVADLGQRVRKIVISSGVTTTLAGIGNAGSADGSSLGAHFDEPKGVAISNAGTFAVVADTMNQVCT